MNDPVPIAGCRRSPARRLFSPAVQAQAAGTPPNIVVIMTDDVAPFDISAIHRGWAR